MRITYIARSFLDYRIPVLAELNRLADGHLTFITSTKWSPQRALARLRDTLGAQAVCLAGERSLGVDVPAEANRSFCVPFQPGLLRAIRESRPEVLVGDGFFQWTFAALVDSKRTETPLVVCYERWAHTERGAQWYRRLYRRWALSATDAMCCTGRLSREYAESLGMPPSRITTGHMAADVADFAAAARAVTPERRVAVRAGWNAEGCVFLCVGQLIPRKGVRELLEGWARLEAAGSDAATLVIIGDGPERASLEAQRDRLGLRGVRFLGSIDYSNLAECYAAADALVMPTLEDNWSLVVPEAMACGLPILCSRYNGCWPELAQEGRNGWVFDPCRPDDTARALGDCVRAAGRLPGMGEASREIVQDHGPQRAGEAIHQACLHAMAHRPAASRDR